MHAEPEPRAWSACRPFEPLEIAIRIAERGDRAATDQLLDTNGFAPLVINEVQLRQAPVHPEVVGGTSQALTERGDSHSLSGIPPPCRRRREETLYLS